MSYTDEEMATALDEVKGAMRRAGVNSVLDTELENLIETCLADLGIAGVDGAMAIITNPMIRLEFILFCKMHSGSPTPEEFKYLKLSYDEIKASLSMATGYTDYSMIEEDEDSE